MANHDKIKKDIEERNSRDVEGENIIIQRACYDHIQRQYAVATQEEFDKDIKQLLSFPQKEIVDLVRNKMRLLIIAIPKIKIGKKNGKVYLYIERDYK